jgi:hypothetical protein
MTTAYTSLLGLALPVTGELSGTWGDTVNDSITSLLDTAVAGTTNVSSDSNVTLTTTTGASNQARQAILLFSGARTAIRTVTAPAQSKIYTVINATTGGFAVTLVGAGPTTGVTIANGARTVVAWNGSDFVEVSSPSSIILPGGTANGVLYLNGSKVVTSGSTFQFDGSGKLALGNVAHTSFIPTTVLTLGNSGANAEIRMGQVDTSALISKWVYNATVGNAYGAIETYGQSNYIQFGASDFRWQVASSEQMRLTSTGLGIGTSSPSEKLEVIGNARVTSASGTTVFAITDTSSGGRQYSLISSGVGNAHSIAAGSFYIRDSSVGATRVVLDSSGNLGLGVTPSAWSAVTPALQIGGAGSFIAAQGNSTPAIYMGANASFNGSGWLYKITNVATLYAQDTGEHKWFRAASGTAGNAITFTQAMTLDASGRLGIKQTSPTVDLDVGANDNTVAVLSVRYSTVPSYLSNSFDGTSGFTTLSTNSYNSSSGSSSWSAFQNTGYSNAAIQLVSQVTSNGSQIRFLTASAANTDPSERARITSGGDLWVGTTSATSGAPHRIGVVYDTSTAWALATKTNDRGWVNIQTNSSGGIAAYFEVVTTNVGAINTTASSTSYVTSSDYRLKNTIAPMTGALAKVALLKPVTYKWNVNGSDGQGFIAHELQAVVPECVVGEKDAVDAEGNPKYQGIDTSFLVATLTAALQEQQAIIESLKARLDAANL